jgi:cystathionine beta-lyase/cystathionine gamma-synthase
MDAFLVLRGTKTPPPMERHSENALALAKVPAAHELVERGTTPAPNHPQYASAAAR